MSHRTNLAVFAALVGLSAHPSASAQITSVEVPQARQLAVLPNAASWEMTARNGRRYQIFAAWPDTPPPPEGWPVYYVLDGNTTFNTMVEAVRAMARRPVGKQALVIGIGYPPDLDRSEERKLDLTAKLGSAPPIIAGAGGAENFLTFVADELKPDIARRWHIDTKRETLFGHSFGGHFVLYALINRPDLFDNWIAASPSIWAEDKLLTRNALRKRIAPKLAESGQTPRVLITAGEYEEAMDPDFPNPRFEQLLVNKMVSNAREYTEFLAGVPGLEARFELLAHEDHGTVIPVAISRAVRFVTTPAKSPGPAPRPLPYRNDTGIPIPTIGDYLKLTAEQRYQLRARGRKLSEHKHGPWVTEFDRMLAAGLTYGVHRQLAEEKDQMDKKHGTKPRE